jgi:hypothetical protein
MIRLVPLALLSATLIACSGDDTTTDSATTGVTDSGTTGGTDSGTTNGTDSGTTADSGTTGPTDSGGPPSDVDGDGFSVDEGDCDDDDDAVYPGATEDLTNGDDDDCDGLFDDLALMDSDKGDLILNELMVRPLEGDPDLGEWVELVNTSDVLIDLEGLILTDGDGNTWTLPDHVGIEPGGWFVLGASDVTDDNGDYTPDAVFSSVALADDTGSLVIASPAENLDTVAWDSANWPTTDGASMTLWSGAVTGLDNDAGGNWCDASTAFGAGDLGTPGSANDACPAFTDSDGDGEFADSDCDDDDAAVNSSATEVCDSIDNDCDGNIDDDDSSTDYTGELTYYDDIDGDGFGDETDTGTAYCDDPGDVSTDNTDCDDSDGTINPSATEVCDGVDNDCNALTDDDDSSTDYTGELTYYDDIDGDGFGDETDSGTAYCDDPGDVSTDNTDCDDSDGDSYPGATEIAGDGIDQDCDGSDLARGTPLSDLILGELVITEIMLDPEAVSDSVGEWFELYNNTADEVNLDGLEITDNGTNSTTLSGEILVAAGTYAVICVDQDTSTNGGVACDAEWGTYTLGNTDDEVVLSYGSVEFDRVEYDGGFGFVNPTGASLSLDSGVLDFTDNDDGSNWCEATSSYGDGDLGTPGSANDACPTTSFTYTWDDDIEPMFAVCSACHSGGSASGGFSDVLVYSDLADVLSIDVGSMPYIDAAGGDVANSYIWHKISDTQATVGGAGAQMPKGGPFFSKAELAVVATWIGEGAPEN